MVNTNGNDFHVWGEFLNGFATDTRVLAPVALLLVGILILFSILYNKWMGELGDKKRGYTALLVALGNLVTLAAVAVISWKAAAVTVVAFAISGLAMIAGDVARGQAQREQAAHVNGRPRRKALPYAAAGLVDEALMLLADAQRAIKRMLAGDLEAARIGLVGMQITEAVTKLTEARKTEGE